MFDVAFHVMVNLNKMLGMMPDACADVHPEPMVVETDLNKLVFNLFEMKRQGRSFFLKWFGEN